MLEAPKQLHLPALLAAWAPPFLWMLAILSFSGDLGAGPTTLGLLKWLLSGVPFLTTHDIITIHWYLRKLGHMAAYGVLYLLWLRALNRQAPAGWSRARWVGLLLTLAVALADEGIQTFFPHRTGCLSDVALDMAGAGLAAFIAPRFVHFFNPGQGRGKAARE